MGKVKEESQYGLWESILAEVAHAARVPDSTLLCLGRPGVGKRTLLRAIQTHAWPANAAASAEEEGHSRAVALDYAYFAVRDPKLDEAAATQDFVCPAACSVLILEEAEHEKLLKKRVMASGGLKNCAALVCLDMKEPWTIMEDLRRWLAVLQSITADLMQDLKVAEQDELRNRITKVVAEYRVPTESSEKPSGLSKAEELPAEGETHAEDMVYDSCVTYNLGIPLLIAVLRADASSVLETQKTAGWVEIIEASLRSECLPFGATIMYTMVQKKNNRNIEAMYDYLMHRLYGYPFRHVPVAPSRDALLVPSGWDDSVKLDKSALGRSFESVVVSPAVPQAPPPPADECQDMQAFLAAQAVVAHRLDDSSGATVMKSARVTSSITSSASRGPANIDMERPAAPLARPSVPVSATDNASLQNFFQTLLSRGSQGGAPGPAPGAQAPVAKPSIPNLATAATPGSSEQYVIHTPRKS